MAYAECLWQIAQVVRSASCLRSRSTYRCMHTDMHINAAHTALIAGHWAQATSTSTSTSQVHRGTSTAIAHLAPTMGPGGVPGSDPPQKEPNEREDGVFVCCGVYGVNETPFGTPHPHARLKKPLNWDIAALVLPPPSLFWPPSAGERAPP
jgi:hypothetical protein